VTLFSGSYSSIIAWN